MNDVIQWGECESILADETPQDRERQPCPSCGSLKRIIPKELVDFVQLYDSVRLQQRVPGVKRPVVDHFSGFDFMQKTGTFSDKI
jgi:hypothetical protein